MKKKNVRHSKTAISSFNERHSTKKYLLRWSFEDWTRSGGKENEGGKSRIKWKSNKMDNPGCKLPSHYELCIHSNGNLIILSPNQPIEWSTFLSSFFLSFACMWVGRIWQACWSETMAVNSLVSCYSTKMKISFTKNVMLNDWIKSQRLWEKEREI